MHRFTRNAAALALSASFTSVPALAQDMSALQSRLDALEEQVQQLEARNLQLEADSEAGKKKMSSMMMADKEAGIPVLTSYAADGKTVRFSFKPRATIEWDYAGFVERKGGFDYNNGTNVRRGRIGLEGTAFTDWKWRIEADFNDPTSVQLTDMYLQYAGFKKTTLTLGQYKMPFTLEGTGSDNYNTFLERAFFVNAFEAGAGRRLGAGIDTVFGPFNVGLAISGDNNTVTRATLTAADPKIPDESVGVHGRVTYETNVKKVGIHLGGSGYWRGDLNQGIVRYGDRPGSRVDNTRILDTGNIGEVNDTYFLGAEAIAAYGPFSLQAEYGRSWVKRGDTLVNGVYKPNADLDFDGYYVMGSWLVTGESRPFKNGTLDRIKPKRNVGEGGIGAWEIAFRYDTLDLTGIPNKLDNRAWSYTSAINWYFNPNMKLMFNWMRFEGRNTPLDPVGGVTEGDVFTTRVHVDF